MKKKKNEMFILREAPVLPAKWKRRAAVGLEREELLECITVNFIDFNLLGGLQKKKVTSYIIARVFDGLITSCPVGRGAVLSFVGCVQWL